MGMDRKIEKKSWTPKRIAILSLSGIFMIFVIYTLLTVKSNQLRVNKERITIATNIPFSGTVIPKDTRSIVAVEGGRIESVFVQTGTMIKKGDKIMKLSNTNLLLDIMYREAELYRQSNSLRNTRLEFERYSIQLDQQLAEIKFNLIEADNNYKRYKYLYAEKIISKQEFETAENRFNYYQKKIELTEKSKQKDLKFRSQQIKQLENSLNRMKQNLKIVKAMQDELTIRAPITGLLSLIDLQLGESYPPGRRLGQIDIQNSFKVRAEISEHYISRVEIGRAGTFKYSDRDYKLVSAMIYPEVDEGVFKVDFNFIGEKPEGVRRGQSFHINFELGDLGEAVLVPRGPFYNKTGGYWIFVLDSSATRAIKRNIKIGRQNPLFYEVLEGLEPGEKVVTSSYDNFGKAEELILKNK